MIDETIEIGLTALLVPGTAPYRPLWTGLGVLAGELMLIVYVSFALRKRIGIRQLAAPPLDHVWRGLPPPPLTE